MTSFMAAAAKALRAFPSHAALLHDGPANGSISAITVMIGYVLGKKRELKRTNVHRTVGRKVKWYNGKADPRIKIRCTTPWKFRVV